MEEALKKGGSNRFGTNIVSILKLPLYSVQSKQEKLKASEKVYSFEYPKY